MLHPKAAGRSRLCQTREELSSPKEDQISGGRRTFVVREIRNETSTEYRAFSTRMAEKRLLLDLGHRGGCWNFKDFLPSNGNKRRWTLHESSTNNGALRCQQQTTSVLGHQLSSKGPPHKKASIQHPSKERKAAIKLMAQMMWPKCASPQTVMDEELLERKIVTIIQELVQSTKKYTGGRLRR